MSLSSNPLPLASEVAVRGSNQLRASNSTFHHAVITAQVGIQGIGKRGCERNLCWGGCNCCDARPSFDALDSRLRGYDVRVVELGTLSYFSAAPSSITVQEYNDAVQHRVGGSKIMASAHCLSN
jgi:hypothetical protein